jgi:hypothetical protein
LADAKDTDKQVLASKQDKTGRDGQLLLSKQEQSNDPAGAVAGTSTQTNAELQAMLDNVQAEVDRLVGQVGLEDPNNQAGESDTTDNNSNFATRQQLNDLKELMYKNVESAVDNSSDGDANTTYDAGSGLNLSDTTFSTSPGSNGVLNTDGDKWYYDGGELRAGGGLDAQGWFRNKVGRSNPMLDKLPSKHVWTHYGEYVSFPRGMSRNAPNLVLSDVDDASSVVFQMNEEGTGSNPYYTASIGLHKGNWSTGSAKNGEKLRLQAGATGVGRYTQFTGTPATRTLEVRPRKPEVLSANYYHPDDEGSGQNDLTASGDYTGDVMRGYLVQIDSTGSNDTFRWKDNFDGNSWNEEKVSISGSEQTLNYGVKINFDSTSGHVKKDTWHIVTVPNRDPFAVQDNDENDLFNILKDGKVGISTSSPSETLSVDGETTVTGTTTLATNGGNVGINRKNPEQALEMSGILKTVNQSAVGPRYYVHADKLWRGTITQYKTSRGTEQSPEAINGGRRIARFGFKGHNGSSYSGGAAIDVEAAQDFSTSTAATRVQFESTAYGATSTSERMRIAGNGNIGINETSPSYKLHVSTSSDGDVAGFTDSNGTCTINPTNTSLDCSSDRQLKKDITTLTDNEDILNELNQLSPVTYRWNDQNNTADKQYGLIAQDVEKVFPEFVSEGPDGYKKLSYSSFIPVNTAAINELNQKVDKIDKDANVSFFENSQDNQSASSSASSSNSATTTDRSVRTAFLRAVAEAVGGVVEKGQVIFEKLTTDTLVVENEIKTDNIQASGKVEGEKLCAGDTCVSESELQQLLAEHKLDAKSSSDDSKVMKSKQDKQTDEDADDSTDDTATSTDDATKQEASNESSGDSANEDGTNGTSSDNVAGSSTTATSTEKSKQSDEEASQNQDDDGTSTQEATNKDAKNASSEDDREQGQESDLSNKEDTEGDEEKDNSKDTENESKDSDQEGDEGDKEQVSEGKDEQQKENDSDE